MPTAATKPTSPGRRHSTYLKRNLTASSPTKSLLTKTLNKKSGRNSTGKITIRHRGGGHKRKLRLIDFKRNKHDIPGIIKTIEYDPNRSCNIALVLYPDGDKRYIIAPVDVKTGSQVIASKKAEINPGNALPLENIPVGMPIHNLEIKPGKGGQLVRSAGSAATIQSKEGKYATVLMPSKEIRLININCLATIGQVSNPDHSNVKLGKAGRRRHMGWRPTVRGTAQHPGSHPHGGGEGRSGVGMKYPKTPWGKHALGKITRKGNKYSNKYIIKNSRSSRTK